MTLFVTPARVRSDDLSFAGCVDDPGGSEGEGGILGDVEEVRTFEVRVATVIVRGYGVGVDGDFNRGGCEVLFVKFDGAFDAGKGAADGADGEVLGLEADAGVSGIDNPGGDLGVAQEREGQAG